MYVCTHVDVVENSLPSSVGQLRPLLYCYARDKIHVCPWLHAQVYTHYINHSTNHVYFLCFECSIFRIQYGLQQILMYTCGWR